MPPEGIRMNVAQIINIGDIDPRTVATPLPESGKNMIITFRIMLSDPVQQEYSIGIIVAGDVFMLFPFTDVRPATLNQGLHSLPAHCIGCIVLAIAITTSGIIKM